MGLFDFIKKNPSVDTSRLPEFENSGQSPESFSNFTFSRGIVDRNGPSNEIQEATRSQLARNGIQLYPEKPKEESSSELVRSATDTSMMKTDFQPKSSSDVFEELLRKRYQESEDSLKRQRAAEFWGNLANLFGQTVSSAAGARMFSPIKSNTQQYNQAIDRLRDSYNDTLLNYNLYTARAERAAKAEQDKINLKFERDKAIAEIQANLKAGLIDKQKAADLEKQARKAKDAKELEGVKNDFRMKLARYNQGAATGRTKMNNEAAMEREKYRQQEIAKRNGNAGSSSGKKKKYPKMKFGHDGAVTYDLNKDTDVARMYNEGVRIGYFPQQFNDSTKKGMTIDDMREAILTATDDKRPVHDRQQGWSLRDNNNNGWSLKDIE